MTVLKAFDLFIRDRSSYCAPDTIRFYEGHLKFFLAFCALHHYVDFSDIPAGFPLFQEYVLYLLESHGCKNVSIRSYCRAVRSFLRFCYEEGFCQDHLRRIRMPKDDSALKIPLYRDEVAAIDSVLSSGSRDRILFHLLLDCGLRSQEARNLDLEHVDFSHNLLIIVNSKGMRSRIVLVPDFLLEQIRIYLDGRLSGPLLLSRSGGVMTENSVKLVFQKLKESSGVGRLHAHLCRHTFGTSYLVGGGNLEFLRALMGHYDYSVTKQYVQLSAQIRMLDLPIYQLDPIFFRRGY